MTRKAPELETIEPELELMIDKFTNLIRDVLTGKITGKATKAILTPYKRRFERNNFDQQNIARIATAAVMEDYKIENLTEEESQITADIKETLNGKLFRTIIFKIIKRKVDKNSAAKTLEELLIDEIKNNSEIETEQELLQKRTGIVLAKIWGNIETDL